MLGQLCRFLHKLLSRCAHPKSYPLSTSWFDLVTVDLGSLKLLPPADFLKKLKLRVDLDQACRIKAERDLAMKPGGSDFSEQVAKVKEEFALKARSYFVFLLRRIREHVSLTADIVRGLASFDTTV